MSVDRRTFLGGVAAAAVAAPAVAEAAIAVPAVPVPAPSRLSDLIVTRGDIGLPPGILGHLLYVYNESDEPISVYGPAAESVEPKRGRAFLAISESTWVPLIV
jgi:hypothetical protein